MSYPNSIKQFVTKIDKNASGWYVSNEFFNVPSASPYEMYLDHVPRDAATTVVGASGGAAWTLVTTAPGPTQYNMDFDYGKVTFSAAAVGAAVRASYYNLGDDIMAEHVNTLQGEVVIVEGTLGTGVTKTYSTVKDRLDAIDSAVVASGVNGQRITDNTVRSGALMNDIKGSSWVSYGRPTLASNAGDLVSHKNVSVNGHAGTAIAISAPIGTTTDTVQEHVDAAGVGIVSDRNPHGLSLYDINEGIVNGNIGAKTISAHTVVASGNIMPIAGSTVPASGMYDVGSAACPWASGNFHTVQADHFKTGASNGATGIFTTAGTFTIFVQNGLIVQIL